MEKKIIALSVEILAAEFVKMNCNELIFFKRLYERYDGELGLAASRALELQGINKKLQKKLEYQLIALAENDPENMNKFIPFKLKGNETNEAKPLNRRELNILVKFISRI